MNDNLKNRKTRIAAAIAALTEYRAESLAIFDEAYDLSVRQRTAVNKARLTLPGPYNEPELYFQCGGHRAQSISKLPDGELHWSITGPINAACWRTLIEVANYDVLFDREYRDLTDALNLDSFNVVSFATADAFVDKVELSIDHKVPQIAVRLAELLGLAKRPNDAFYDTKPAFNKPWPKRIAKVAVATHRDNYFRWHDSNPIDRIVALLSWYYDYEFVLGKMRSEVQVTYNDQTWPKKTTYFPWFELSVAKNGNATIVWTDDNAREWLEVNARIGFELATAASKETT